MRKLTVLGAALALATLLAPQGALAQGMLSVSESAVATGVVDRMPIESGTSFRTDVGRVYAWTQIVGANDGTTIHHVWIQGDVERADLELQIGGSPWRTWSNKAIPPEWAGDWRVEVRDSRGNVIETLTFTVGG